MYILAIDTSNQALGVAILKNNELIGEVVTNIAKNHSVRLMPALNQLMNDVHIKPEQLEKIIVSKGPGSYTGVRIGVTTAKTLAWTLNIPIVGVSSLDVLAYQGSLSDRLICPFFDARRGLVYTGLYRFDNNTLEYVLEERNILMTDWLNIIKEKNKEVLFLSPDIDKHIDTIKDHLASLAEFPVGRSQIASPYHLGLIGNTRPVDSTHELVPNYLRLAEAEANWLKDQKKND